MVSCGREALGFLIPAPVTRLKQGLCWLGMWTWSPSAALVKQTNFADSTETCPESSWHRWWMGCLHCLWLLIFLFVSLLPWLLPYSPSFFFFFFSWKMAWVNLGKISLRNRNSGVVLGLSYKCGFFPFMFFIFPFPDCSSPKFPL